MWYMKMQDRFVDRREHLRRHTSPDEVDGREEKMVRISNQLASFIRQFKLEREPSLAGDIVMFGDREDLTDDDRLISFLERSEKALVEHGISDHRVSAAVNIVNELAANVSMHGSGRREMSEFLVISEYAKSVSIWLFGYGPAHHVERMRRIMDNIYKIASPPNHREVMLARRNSELIRTAALPDAKSSGGGAGLLTIAALSSERVRVTPGRNVGGRAFVLHSIV